MKVATVSIKIVTDTGEINYTNDMPKEIASYLLQLAMGWEEKFTCTPQTHERYLKAVKIRDENEKIKEKNLSHMVGDINPEASV